MHLTNMFNHCNWLSHLSTRWKEARIIILPDQIKVRLTSTPRVKIFEKETKEVLKRHMKEGHILSASQFGVHTHHSSASHFRLTDSVNLYFKALVRISREKEPNVRFRVCKSVHYTFN
jgi:hypothetical protein